MLNRIERTVQVTGEMKIGHFSVTFEDVTIPLAGLPVTLTRTYESREPGYCTKCPVIRAADVRLRGARQSEVHGKRKYHHQPRG